MLQYLQLAPEEVVLVTLVVGEGRRLEATGTVQKNINHADLATLAGRP